MSEAERTVINCLDPDGGPPITLVPLCDNLYVQPLTPQYIDALLKTPHQYAIVETKVFNNLMNMGISPNWFLQGSNNKPMCWNPGTKSNKYIARLVADAKYCEEVNCIDGNNSNLRYYNIEKVKKEYNPERRDREDIVKSEYTQPFKSVTTYQQYDQPTYQYK